MERIEQNKALLFLTHTDVNFRIRIEMHAKPGKFVLYMASI